MSELDPDLVPSAVAADRSVLSVRWPDGHLSRFLPDLLRERSVAPEPRTSRQLWTSGYMAEVKRYQFRDLVEDERELLECLENLASHGFTLIVGFPSVEDLRSLYRRLGPPKTTHFGDDWQVKVLSSTSNVGYTTASLGLHTDLPFYYYTPGLMMLYAIRQHRSGGRGGDRPGD